MSAVIWKFSLPGLGLNRLRVPEGARLLAFAMQGTVPMVWAVVNPDRELATIGVFVTGTGIELPASVSNAPHLGTVQDGMLVWHAFEVPL